MPDISKITLPSGTTYDIKDTVARQDIEEIKESISSGVSFIGQATTAITDQATTNPITIDDEFVTATKGDLVVYGSKEFIFSGTKWIEFGDLGSLGALAFKNSATGGFAPAGTVSQPTFTGTQSNVTITSEDNSSGNYQPAGTVSQPTFTGGTVNSTGKFTPSGSVAAPTVSVKTAGSTTTVNSITDVGSLPNWSATVANETLSIGWNAGALPTKGTDTTVKTGDAAYEASAPTFTGTEDDVNVSGTAAGTVSQPTFTGTKVQLSGTTTAEGTVSQPTFTGSQGTVTVS